MDGIDVSRGGDMEFLRGSTDSQWSCLYIHHLLLASAVRQSIVEDMAIRSKLELGVEHRKTSGTIPTDILSRAPEYVYLSSNESASEISHPFATCTVDSRYHKNSMTIILLSNHHCSEF